MFEILKIRLFGIQPTPSIDSKEISKIIRSDFTDQIEYVKSKLNRIESDSPKGKNRICAAILKLADGNLEKLDPIIDKANFDYRDIVSAAEYPRCSRFDFEERDQTSDGLHNRFPNKFEGQRPA